MSLDLSPIRTTGLTATEWSTVEEKAKFANHLIKFISKDFPETQFHDWFYKRLSNTFGFIAHYNRDGFYGTYFRDLQGKLRFLECLTRWTCHGDPAFTYSDVEKIIRARIHASGLIQEFTDRIQRQHELNERAQLAKLKAKYETPKVPAGRVIAVRRAAPS